jgi:ABC-type nitrate/sulfonate/bicarbonate transport system ATPase subunit
MEKMNNVEYILDIRLDSKSYGFTTIINNLNLKVKKGEFVSILGKSGIGKSTLLRLISGIDLQYSGKIIFEGKVITEPIESIVFLFQNNYLLPWLTVEENIKFFNQKIELSEIKDYLKLVGLEGKNSSFPNELSGGEMKRVGLSIALINKCKLLLLDEPFSDLDLGVKGSLFHLINNIVQKNNLTVIMTTHNLDDALALSDRLILFSDSPMKITFDTNILNHFDKELIRRKALEVFVSDEKA